MSDLEVAPQDASESLATGDPPLLHEYFARAARRWPQHIAIDVPPGPDRPERQQITYAELQRQVGLLAHALQPVVTAECVVAILLPRATHLLYAAQLAVLQAGAAYTCLDGSLPDDHLAWVLTDARAVAVVTNAAGRERLARLPGRMPRVIDVAECMVRQRSGAIPPAWLGSGSLAYVIYTSGTTGRPKGVMIEHRSIANLVGSDLAAFQLRPDDRVAQGSSPAYDSSLEETWLALAAGAAVVVMDDDAARLGPDLVGWLRRERITVLCPPPTQLRAMGCADPETTLPGVRFLYVGGEALPQDLADSWSRGRWLENGYGPTECTVTVVRARMQEGRPVVIGKPVRGHRAWILDGKLAEVPDGQAGELCISGIGLARGYLNQPELTAERFPIHPRLGRIYRTGDLVQRDATGNLVCLGRIDGQVKVRGYRVELAAIEARIQECPGVRAAACKLQGEGSDQVLVAFVVPSDPEAPPEPASIRSALCRTLPEYMVPGRYALLAALPTTVGGKLDRRALPAVAAEERSDRAADAAPRDELERVLAVAFAAQLGLPQPPSIHSDFFELGGNSLRAAELISRLRPDPRTAGLAVRDVYDGRTVAGLARRARAACTTAPRAEPQPSAPGAPAARPVLATVAQTVWLLLGLVAVSNFLYAAVFVALPGLVRWLGLAGFLLLSPAIGLGALLLYGLLTVALAVLAKRVLVGRYRPLRAPVWGSFFVRNWIVQRMVQLVPWWLLQGTVFQSAVLRALGARIGRRLHLSRGVDLLQGGWDLLEIGDDVSLGHDASLRLVELEDGHIVVGPVVLQDGSTLDARAGMAPHTAMESGAFLAASSSLPSHRRVPRGARWDGVPAQPAGTAPVVPPLPVGERSLSPFWHGVAMMLVHFGVAVAVLVPVILLAILVAAVLGISTEQLLERVSQASTSHWSIALTTACVVAAVPIMLVVQALMLRWSRRIRTGPISRFGPEYIRATLKNAVVESAGAWLSGTLFWPVWLRMAGMTVGRKCEISTIMDVIPEHVSVGNESFLADGIYLGSPRVQRGTVTLSTTRLGNSTFLGNHVVVAAGQSLPDGVLLGVCTVADDRQARPATSWFGHPPFELPRREVVACDRRLTHDPGPLRYATRVFWEALRFLLPVVPVWLLLVWLDWLDASAAACSLSFLLVAVPAVTFAVSAAACLLVLALKWVLLGRVRPGQHPLWSCWCSRWDFLYVAWSLYARRLLATLEGTLILSWYLRAMGAHIGKSVVLGNGFSQVVDPDMLHFEDGATVHAMFQAHSFEDRVLKIDHVRIRHGATVGQAAVLLYGAEIGERCWVAPHSVVMKHEHLLPDQTYGGCPTRPLAPDLAR